jgi:hypothetical protein
MRRFIREKNRFLFKNNSILLNEWIIIMAITRSDELRHSPAARDTKSSSRIIAIISE